MKTLVFGTTQDAWSKIILKQAPRGPGRKILYLPSRFGQIFLTWPGRWLGYRVIWLADNNQLTKLYSLLAKLVIKSAHCLIVPNQAVEVRYLKIGVPGAKIATLYPAVRVAENIIFPPLANFTLGCDARISLANGLGTLLKATALAKDILGSIKLIIAGPVKNRAQIEWSVRSLGLAGRVQFSPGESDIWLEEIHAYLLPQAAVGILPLSLLSAMGLGRAVIATDKLEHKEFIKDKERGLLIAANNAAVLSQAIITLARDKALLLKISQANRDFVAERQVTATKLRRHILED